ncbi:MAG: hypothetical protein QW136_00155 [Nitrososphaerales archaeon]
MMARYININIKDAGIIDGHLNVFVPSDGEWKRYTMSDGFSNSLNSALNVDDGLNAIGVLDKEMILYVVGDKAVGIFPCNVSIFRPDDALAMRNRFMAEGWYVHEHRTSSERTNSILFNRETHDSAMGPIRIGIFINIPHDAVEPATFYTAIERTLNHSYFIFDDKNSILKADFYIISDYLGWVYESAKAAVQNISNTIKKWLIDRLSQLRETPASLEECIKICEKTNKMACGVIDIESILIKHGLAAPSDAWSMFRRQANTPYNRLELAIILSEYATHMASKDNRFDLMADAGRMILDRGDLESRPVWVAWDMIDRTGDEYLLKHS